MKKPLFALCVMVWLGAVAQAQQDVKISLANSSPAEQQTKAQLERLLKTYGLSKWIMTKSVVIDEKAIPHSHPVLTLSARHVKDDELLLATFVHEEMHWFVIQDGRDIDAAIAEFKKMFPNAADRAARRRPR